MFSAKWYLLNKRICTWIKTIISENRMARRKTWYDQIKSLLQVQIFFSLFASFWFIEQTQKIWRFHFVTFVFYKRLTFVSHHISTWLSMYRETIKGSDLSLKIVCLKRVALRYVRNIMLMREPSSRYWCNRFFCWHRQ